MFAQPTVTSAKIFKAAGRNGQVGWASWGKNNLILYSQLRLRKYELRVANPDGTGDQCVTCGMSQFKTVSAGAGSFSPDGKWIIFMGQLPGADPSVKPGGATGYAAWLTDWPVRKGPWLVGPKSSSLWPQWSTDGTRYAFTNLYRAIDTAHPMGWWKVYTQVFNAANPGGQNVVTSCEIPQSQGMHEMGDWYDTRYLAVMAQAGMAGAARYEYIGYKLNTDDCTAVTITDPKAATWVEFIRLPPKWSPTMFLSGSKQGAPTPFCTSSATPCTDEVYQLPGVNPRTTLISCSDPKSALYLKPAVFCAIHGFSPDGMQAIIQQQTDSMRQLWLLKLK